MRGSLVVVDDDGLPDHAVQPGQGQESVREESARLNSVRLQAHCLEGPVPCGEISQLTPLWEGQRAILRTRVRHLHLQRQTTLTTQPDDPICQEKVVLKRTTPWMD